VWDVVHKDASLQRSKSTHTVAPPESAAPARHRFAMRPLRRSSTRLQKWVQDQQKRQSSGSAEDGSEDSHVTDVPTPGASSSHAWLAYPHLNMPKTPPRPRGQYSNVEDTYVFVEEEDVVDLSATTGRYQVSCNAARDSRSFDNTDTLSRRCFLSVPTSKSSTSLRLQRPLASPASFQLDSRLPPRCEPLPEASLTPVRFQSHQSPQGSQAPRVHPRFSSDRAASLSKAARPIWQVLFLPNAKAANNHRTRPPSRLRIRIGE
jgi:hypothetical protein